MGPSRKKKRFQERWPEMGIYGDSFEEVKKKETE